MIKLVKIFVFHRQLCTTYGTQILILVRIC